jgi:hypothetical protein
MVGSSLEMSCFVLRARETKASPNAGVGTVERSSVQSEEDSGSRCMGNTPQEEMERSISEEGMRRNAFIGNRSGGGSDVGRRRLLGA